MGRARGRKDIFVVILKTKTKTFCRRQRRDTQCDSCGWNTDDDVKKGEMGWGPEPHHRPGCKLRDALAVTRYVLETA